MPMLASHQLNTSARNKVQSSSLWLSHVNVNAIAGIELDGTNHHKCLIMLYKPWPSYNSIPQNTCNNTSKDGERSEAERAIATKANDNRGVYFLYSVCNFYT